MKTLIVRREDETAFADVIAKFRRFDWQIVIR